MRVTLALVSLLAAVLLAGCGGSSPAREAAGLEEVLAELDGLAGPAREQRLVELAAAEGGVVSLYTSTNLAVVDELVGAFEDAYGIDVAVYKGGGEEVFRRLVEESAAGFRGADAIVLGGLEMVGADAEGILAPYASPSAERLLPGTAFATWAANATNTYALTWNTDLVLEGSQPATWEELADPAFAGRLALAASDVEWYQGLWTHLVESEGMSEGEADALFEGIARNARVASGHSVLTELHAAGEYELSVNFVHLVENAKADGIPLEWRPPVEPAIVKLDGVGLAATALHPAAGMLFVDWLLGPGQEVFAAFGIATRADLAQTADVETRIVDVEALAAELEDWSERYDRLLQLGAGDDAAG